MIELHGRNDRVVCTSCGYDCSRRIIQKQIEVLNSLFLEKIVSLKLKELTRVEREGIIRADGDTELGISDFSEVRNSAHVCMYVHARTQCVCVCACVSMYVRTFYCI